MLTGGTALCELGRLAPRLHTFLNEDSYLGSLTVRISQNF